MLAETCELTVLGEFKPFGLVAEVTEGNVLQDCNSLDKYDYFLFNPSIVRGNINEETSGDFCASSLSEQGDHELFIKGDSVTWSAGCRILKRFTLKSQVVKACWCRFDGVSEDFLCVLGCESLTIYSVSGEVASISLSRKINSIWPLPFGLLLQHAAEGHTPIHSSYHSLNSCRLYSEKKEFSNFSLGPSCISHDNLSHANSIGLSSHLILKDLFEEPQLTYVKERGRLSTMRDCDEKTIWTSELAPLMVSYNKGKMQHSVWFLEFATIQSESASTDNVSVPESLASKKVSFQRIWQGKVSRAAASKIFLATDEDGSLVICFLLGEQKRLLSIRLESFEINNDIVFDIKSDMSWSIPATSALPVTVTKPRVKVGVVPHADIIVVDPKNCLYLYCGKQCLCKFVFPPWFSDCEMARDDHISGSDSRKILSLDDAVEGRVNVTFNGGKIYRCELQKRPSSSLVSDCMTVMTEGLSSQLYNRFLTLYWRSVGSEKFESMDSAAAEWKTFSTILLQPHLTPSIIPSVKETYFQNSWKFLVNSKYNSNYKGMKMCFDTFPVTIHVPNPAVTQNFCFPQKNCSDCSIFRELLEQSLDLFHAVYESLKLDNLRKRDLERLSYLLCNVAYILGEGGYVDYYVRDFPHLFEKVGIDQTMPLRRTPSNLFRWLEYCLRCGVSYANVKDLPVLIFKEECFAVNLARKIVVFYMLLSTGNMEGGKLPFGLYCSVAKGSYSTGEELVVLGMVGENFGLQELDRLPSGISLSLRHAIDQCRDCPPTDWPVQAYNLVGRQDLAMSGIVHSLSCDEVENLGGSYLISMSTPYMQHLRPVTIPSIDSDTSGSTFDGRDTTEPSSIDGMEHIFNKYTQLRYGRDLRLTEVRRILCSSKPVAIKAPINPSGTDQDAQQAQLWQMAQRTTALPIGRGAFTLATIHTLLTEVFAAPKLELAGRLPAQQNATVNLDPNLRNLQDLRTWPEFHNAVAAGLKLAPLQGKVSRTWIIYNKPQEPSSTHAGLLFSLGLHGFLRVLVITDIYSYYTQEHDCTSVGLMLGLAASYRGTMQPAISKSLYVHISSRHSSTYPELELPTLMQTAALVSVGLLYQGSVHPQTMQTLMNEFGRRTTGDNVLEREGHVVAAGFALGLVTLGRGVDAHGYTESVVGQLIRYVGCQEYYKENAPSTQFSDDYNRGTLQIMDASVNADVTSPGAIVALTLMFLKTESEIIYARLSIPKSHFDLLYLRPNFIMLRVIACSMIMWSRVNATKDWVESQIPEFVKYGLILLGNNDNDVDEMDAKTYVQAYINIVTGACISLGLRFAGTKDANVQELLYEYALYFLNEIKLVCTTSNNSNFKGLAQYIDRGTLENCLHLVVLSLTMVMAGSGNLTILRLLRFLNGRNATDGHFNYGVQMVISMAIGFLYLGGGMRTFSTSTGSIAALLISVYPRLPTGPNDNRCHLQAFRHLYVLASESRWLQTVDVDNGQTVYVPVKITVGETKHYAETTFCEMTPCILPERSILKSVRVCGPRYWSLNIDLVPEDKNWWAYGCQKNSLNSGILFVKRKVGACSYMDDPVGCQSLLSRVMQKITKVETTEETCNGVVGSGPASIDDLVGTFSSDPSLISFARLCCKSSLNSRMDSEFQQFCLQVLVECIGKDRPGLVQVYLSLYNCIQGMAYPDPMSVTNIKMAVAYYIAVTRGRLRGGIVETGFLSCLAKRMHQIVSHSDHHDVQAYLRSDTWPRDSQLRMRLLASYLQWYGFPPPSLLKQLPSPISVPFLKLLFPTTHLTAICRILDLH